MQMGTLEHIMWHSEIWQIVSMVKLSISKFLICSQTISKNTAIKTAGQSLKSTLKVEINSSMPICMQVILKEQ